MPHGIIPAFPAKIYDRAKKVVAKQTDPRFQGMFKLASVHNRKNNRFQTWEAVQLLIQFDLVEKATKPDGSTWRGMYRVKGLTNEN